MSLVLTIAVTAVAPFFPRAAQAQNITVPTGSAADLINAIQTANANAMTPAIINVSGTYTLSSALSGVPFVADGNNGLPSITTDITIVGMGAVIERDPTPGCTLDNTTSNDKFRIFHVASTGKLTLDGITVKNGCADGAMSAFTTERAGGGILNYGETDLHGSTLSDNSASYYGGGIRNSDGTVNVLDQSVLSDNYANDTGGAIDNEGADATVHVTDSTISDNQAQYFGGGLSNYLGKIYLTRSTISGNQCGTEGGGVFNSFSTQTIIPVLDIMASTFDDNMAAEGGAIKTYERMDIVDSTFSNNTATGGNGGAISKRGLELNVTNSTFSGNVAMSSGEFTGLGGAIYSLELATNVTSCTFSDNSASSGGGIYYVDTQGLDVTITNSILANSSGGDCVNGGAGTLVAAGANFDTDGSCKAAATGGTAAFFTTVSSSDLNLDALNLNPPGSTETFALLPGSVAIDAVPPGECTVATDQRGVGRPQGPRCDSGAYEVQSTKASAPALSAGGLILLAVLLALVPWYPSRRKRMRFPSRELPS